MRPGVILLDFMVNEKGVMGERGGMLRLRLNRVLEIFFYGLNLAE